VKMRKYKIITLDKKEEVMRYYKKHGYKKTINKYKVSLSTLIYWKARIKAASPADSHPLARRYLIRPETVSFVKELHKKNPSYTLRRLQQEVSKKCQSISTTRIWHIIND